MCVRCVCLFIISLLYQHYALDRHPKIPFTYPHLPTLAARAPHLVNGQWSMLSDSVFPLSTDHCCGARHVGGAGGGTAVWLLPRGLVRAGRSKMESVVSVLSTNLIDNPKMDTSPTVHPQPHDSACTTHPGSLVFGPATQAPPTPTFLDPALTLSFPGTKPHPASSSLPCAPTVSAVRGREDCSL